MLTTLVDFIADFFSSVIYYFNTRILENIQFHFQNTLKVSSTLNTINTMLLQQNALIIKVKFCGKYDAEFIINFLGISVFIS